MGASERWNAVAVGATFLVTAATFIGLARVELFPPDADPAYYTMVAQRVVVGLGWTSDVVWQFLGGDPNLPQPAFEFWMPGTTAAVLPFLTLLGPRYASAAIAAAVFGAFATSMVYMFARRILGSLAPALAAAALFASSSRVMLHATSADSTIFATTWTLGSWLAFDSATRASGRRATLLYALAGLFIAAATLTRSDSLPVLVIAMGVAWIAARRWSLPHPRPAQATLAASCIVLPLAAWSMRCWTVFGSAWNPAAGKVAFLPHYADLFAFPPAVGPSAWLSWALSHPGTVLSNKVRASWRLLTWAADLVPLGLLPVVWFGAAILLVRKRPLAVLAAGHLAAAALVYPLLADTLVAGGSHRVVVPFCAFAMTAAVAAIPGVTGLAFRGPRQPTGDRVAAWLCRLLATGSWMFVAGVGVKAWVAPEGDIAQLDQLRAYHAVAKIMHDQGWDDRAALLSMQPIQTAYGTGHPAVMIPSNGLDAACAAAVRWNAPLVVLNGMYLDGDGYQPWKAVYEGKETAPGFAPIGRKGRWLLLEARCRP